MKKRFFIFITIFFIFLLFFNSCKVERLPFLIISCEGKIILFDKNLNKIDEIETGLDGKVLLGEIRNKKVLFNYYSSDFKKSGIFLLDLDTKDILNLTEGLLGNFPYSPKFLDNENILFTLKESYESEYLYIYNLKLKNKKPISTTIISTYIYPIYVDEDSKNVYIHLLKQKEEKSKIAIYSYPSDEFNENYLSFKDNFYFQGNSNLMGEVLGRTFDSKSKISTIEILDLKSRNTKTIFKTNEGEIYNEMFINNSDEIVFKIVPSDQNKKPYIMIIDRNGNILKNFEVPQFTDFYIRGSFENYLYLMAQESSRSKYLLFGIDLEKRSFKKFTNENYFYGGDLIISTSKENIIISEIKEGVQEKNYILMNFNGENKINLNEKLKIKIDSIIFFE